MKRTLVAFLLTVAAVSAVVLVRGSGGPLASGVPAYRVRGPFRARVKIVVFSDFQCPGCAKAEPVLKALLDRHPGEARVAFRHYPLRMHRWSVLAARAAEAAGFQGKFWPYHDLLFQRQKEWEVQPDPTEMFLRYAAELGLDGDRFRRDFQDPRWTALLTADMETARKANVSSTPTIFIGDNRVVGGTQLEADGERLFREAAR